MSAKLSVGRDGLLDSCWCGLGLLACVSNDQVVRVNDLVEDNEADDNFILTLADVPGMEGRQDKLIFAQVIVFGVGLIFLLSYAQKLCPKDFVMLVLVEHEKPSFF